MKPYKRIFKLELGTTPIGREPRLLISLHGPRTDKILIFGRLYRGYVGLMWVTRFFDLNVWIYNMEKVKEKAP